MTPSAHVRQTSQTRWAGFVALVATLLSTWKYVGVQWRFEVTLCAVKTGFERRGGGVLQGSVCLGEGKVVVVKNIY